MLRLGLADTSIRDVDSVGITFDGVAPMDPECDIRVDVGRRDGQLRVTLRFDDVQPRIAARFLDILKGRA